MSRVLLEFKIKKLDGDYNYLNLNIKDIIFFRKFVKCWKLPCEIMKNRVWPNILFISKIDTPYIKLAVCKKFKKK